MVESPNDASGADDSIGPPQSGNHFARIAIWSFLTLGVVGLLVALMLPAVDRSRGPERRKQCMNHLKQIGLALQNYVNAHGAFPPAYTTDADGKPLHSWRTLILPYLDRKPLYDSIDLTKPWDDPVNATACKTVVEEYQCPSAMYGDNLTSSLAVVTPDSCLRATEPRKLSKITDGPGQTLVVIDVDLDHAVPWMSPVDADEEVVLGLGTESNLPHFGRVGPALFVDGSIHYLTVDLPAAQRRALISIAGGDQALAQAALEVAD